MASIACAPVLRLGLSVYPSGNAVYQVICAACKPPAGFDNVRSQRSTGCGVLASRAPPLANGGIAMRCQARSPSTSKTPVGLTAAELDQAGLLHADRGARISRYAVFVPADVHGEHRPV